MSNEKNMKIIVCHPAQQHSYRLATAIKMDHSLFKYLTTVYYRRGTFTWLVALLLRGRFKVKATNRKCHYLSVHDIKQYCEVEGLMKLLALNIPLFAKWYSFFKYDTADRFARKVANYAIKNDVDAVITYDDCSPLLFEILEKKAPHIVRIMDFSAANQIYMKKIYEHDMELQPDFAKKLKEERPAVQSPYIQDRLLREINATQYFLAGSRFVKESLEYSGVKPDQIRVCHYGVDVSQFQRERLLTRKENEPIRFVFVGGTKQLKGLSYMLEAFQHVDHQKATFTIIGIDNLSGELKQKYGKDVYFRGAVLHDQMPQELKKYDVMIFPSLGEGFGLSIIEAMACGLPVIATNHTGGNDIIEDGSTGFVIPIEDEKAIQEKMMWFINHREKIPQMGLSAMKTAKEMTWESYYVHVAKAVKEIIRYAKEESCFAGR